MIFCVVIELTFSYLQIILPSKSVWIIFFGTAQFTVFLLLWDWTLSLSQWVFHSSGVHKVRKQVRRKRAKYLASLSVHILWVVPYCDTCPLFSLIKAWNWTKETHPKRPCKNKIWIYQTGCDFCYFLNLLFLLEVYLIIFFYGCRYVFQRLGGAIANFITDRKTKDNFETLQEDTKEINEKWSETSIFKKVVYQEHF